MLFPLVELDRLIEPVDRAVDPHTRKAFAPRRLERLLVFAFAETCDWGEDQERAWPRSRHNPLDYLLCRLTAYPVAARGAVGEADAGVEHAQIVVNLGDRADGGAWVTGGRLLLDGDGRRETADVVHLGLLILAQKLPRVAGKRFHVAPLPLRVQRVERQARLAGAADARQDDKLIARYLDGDVLEVVLPRTTNDDLLWSHRLGCTFSADAHRQVAAAVERPQPAGRTAVLSGLAVTTEQAGSGCCASFVGGAHWAYPPFPFLLWKGSRGSGRIVPWAGAVSATLMIARRAD